MTTAKIHPFVDELAGNTVRFWNQWHDVYRDFLFESHDETGNVYVTIYGDMSERDLPVIKGFFFNADGITLWDDHIIVSYLHPDNKRDVTDCDCKEKVSPKDLLAAIGTINEMAEEKVYKTRFFADRIEFEFYTNDILPLRHFIAAFPWADDLLVLKNRDNSLSVVVVF